MTTRRHWLRLLKMVAMEAMVQRVVMVRLAEMLETRRERVMVDNQPLIFCTRECRYGIKITLLKI